MTFEEFYDMAGVVVRLRRDLEAIERLATDRERERDQARDELGPVALQLSAHIDALTKSNAQCAEYLRHNEMLRAELDRISAERDTMQTKLHSELVNIRAALAATTEQRDSYKRTLDEWSNADTEPHEPVTADDVADHVVPPVLPMCMTCHGCGSVLEPDSRPGALYCMNFKCERTNTADTDSPYNGPCTSAVRHE